MSRGQTNFGDSFDRHLRQSYGITRAMYDKLCADNGNRCYRCQRDPATVVGWHERGRPPKPKERRRGKRLQVDHDHRTGRVRGLLCMRCNLLVGFLELDGMLTDKDPYLQREPLRYELAPELRKSGRWRVNVIVRHLAERPGSLLIPTGMDRQWVRDDLIAAYRAGVPTERASHRIVNGMHVRGLLVSAGRPDGEADYRYRLAEGVPRQA